MDAKSRANQRLGAGDSPNKNDPTPVSEAIDAFATRYADLLWELY
jgi:hypothetical protein